MKSENIENEIRIKIPLSHVKNIEDKINFESSFVVCDVIFGRFGLDSFQKQGWIARLRQSNSSWSFEVKKQAGQYLWEEVSVQITEPKKYFQILSLIELHPIYMIERKRSTSRWKDLSLSLDNLRWLGYYLEFELFGNNDSAYLFSKAIEFCKEFSLDFQVSPPYGDTIRDRMANDSKLYQKVRAEILNMFLE